MPRYLVSYDVHKNDKARDRVRDYLAGKNFKEVLESAYVGVAETDGMLLTALVDAAKPQPDDSNPTDAKPAGFLIVKLVGGTYNGTPDALGIISNFAFGSD